MKRQAHKIFFLIIVPFSHIAYSQNLVPNPSFEDTVACPSNQNQVYDATGWSSYRKTPDYFNSCSVSNISSLPSNSFGFQLPASCNAYTGLYSWGGFEYREYIGRQLFTPLIIGQKYFVSFKVTLGEVSSCATNNLGVLFSTISFSDSTPAPLINFAHIYTNAIITDTVDWTIIAGSLVTDSNYNYIIIGNFFNDTNTDTIKLTSGLVGYYFIDDICVSTDSVYCYDYKFICNTGINPDPEQSASLFFPNPTGGLIYFNDSERMFQFLRVFDILGNEMVTKQIPCKNYSLDLSKFANGIYLIQTINNEINYSKLIINH